MSEKAGEHALVARARKLAAFERGLTQRSSGRVPEEPFRGEVERLYAEPQRRAADGPGGI